MVNCLLSVILFLSLAFSPIAFCAAPLSASLPGKKYVRTIPPYWEKRFSRGEVTFLRMSGAGNRIMFLAEKEAASSGYVTRTVSTLNMAGETLKSWEVTGAVENVCFDVDAKSLLVMLKNGSSLYYPDLEKHIQYIVIPGAGRESRIFPWDNNVLVAHERPYAGSVPKNYPVNRELFVLSPDDGLLWTYSESSDSVKAPKTGWRWMFGFLQKKRDNYLLKVSNSGDITMNQKDKLLWKSRVLGTPLSVAVPFFDGRRYAVATSGERGRIYFLDDKGRELGSVFFRGGASSMSWSTVGNILAVYANRDRGQLIKAFSAPGRLLWEKIFPEKASAVSKVMAAALGKVVTAGIQMSDGKWVIKSWDNAGDGLWDISVEGELIDFYTAWNGRNVVVLSRTDSGDRLTSYDSRKEIVAK